MTDIHDDPLGVQAFDVTPHQMEPQEQRITQPLANKAQPEPRILPEPPEPTQQTQVPASYQSIIDQQNEQYLYKLE